MLEVTDYTSAKGFILCYFNDKKIWLTADQIPLFINQPRAEVSADGNTAFYGGKRTIVDTHEVKAEIAITKSKGWA